MTHKAYVLFFALITSTIGCFANDAFIATQKAIIQTEEPRLVEAYKNAKNMAKESLADEYAAIKQLIKESVELILATPEFSTYTEYMSDFQASLILKGGLVAEELPGMGPDRNLLSAINRIVTQSIGTDRMATPAVQNLFGAYLTLCANRVGTAALLGKLDQIN